MNKKNMMITQFAILAMSAMRAFANPGWKKDADGKLELDAAGNPIYVQGDGVEQSVDAGTIGKLQGEAKSNRERYEVAETALKTFEGLDGAKAREALATLSKIDQKKLIDAGEVDKVRTEISGQFQTQLDEQAKINADLTAQNHGLIKTNAFAGSEFIANRVSVPRSMFEKEFGGNFKVEDGKVVPYDQAGNRVMSKKKMGEVATVDEAFEIITDGYPYKDTILKANTGSGTGNNGSGGSSGGKRTISRADLAAMPVHEHPAIMAQVTKGEVVLSD